MAEEAKLGMKQEQTIALIVKLFGGENGPVSLKSVVSNAFKNGE